MWMGDAALTVFSAQFPSCIIAVVNRLVSESDPHHFQAQNHPLEWYQPFSGAADGLAKQLQSMPSRC
jgi:hypothetical protein